MHAPQASVAEEEEYSLTKQNPFINWRPSKSPTSPYSPANPRTSSSDKCFVPPKNTFPGSCIRARKKAWTHRVLSSQCWRIHPKIRMPTAIRQPTNPDRDDDTRVAKFGGCVTGYPCCRGAKCASGMRPNTIDDTVQATGKPLPTNCQLPQGGILTCRSYQHWRHARACRANWPRWLSPCYNGASDAAVRPVWEHALLPKPPSLHITRPSFPARGRERGEKRAAHLEPQPVIPHPASLETAHDCNGVGHTRGRMDVKTPRIATVKEEAMRRQV